MEKISGHKISKVFFIVLAGLLLLPWLQMQFSFVEIKPLDGAIEESEKPSLSWDSWIEENYQQETEQYLNQHFGFRNTLVRLYNQTTFWLFDETTARGVVVGRDNYLYERNYIRAYYGDDFIGDSLIRARVNRLHDIQEALSEQDILFAVVLAPGKGQFYPEYIPDYLHTEKGRTNYEVFLEEARKRGLEILDFNHWFLQMKDTAKFPLYPKTGIHWSHYGMNLVVDSLLRFIEARKHIDIPDYVVADYELSENYKEPDTDIEDGMNLMFPIDNFPMPYASHHVVEKGKTKPRIMVVADSFFWQLFEQGILATVFSDGEFWYYNSQILTPSRLSQGPLDVMLVDRRKKLLEKDVVILLTTDANLPQFPWEWDERSWEILYKYDELLQQKRKDAIRGIIENIRGSQEWMDLIEKKAAENEIPVDSMLKLDAIYIYETNRDKYQ